MKMVSLKMVSLWRALLHQDAAVSCRCSWIFASQMLFLMFAAQCSAGIATVDAGGGRSSSSDYTISGSINAVAGTVAEADDIQVTQGFAGQLYEVASLDINLSPSTVVSGGSIQLSGSAVLDDGSVFPVNGSEIQWANPVFPVASIDTNGLARISSLTARTYASISGSYFGITQAKPFWVEIGFGALSVNLLPSQAVAAGARWSVDGAAWSQSGAIVDDLPSGQYTVQFNTIAGWASPTNRIVTISPDSTNTIAATYVQQFGWLRITTIPSSGQWRIDGTGAWLSSGSSVYVPIGIHTVEFSAADGWNSPATKTYTVAANQVTSEVVSYELASVLQFSQSDYTVFDNATNAVVTVNRTGNISKTVTVVCGTSDGSAIDGLNYDGQVKTLTFAPDQKAVPFIVPLIANTSASTNRSFNVHLMDPQGGAVLGVLPDAEVTIIDHAAAAAASRFELKMKRPQDRAWMDSSVLTISQGRSVTFSIQIKNIGKVRDTVVLTGNESTLQKFSIKYLVGSTGNQDITAKVSSGSYTASMAPGETRVFRVVVTASQTVPHKTCVPCVLSACSQKDPTKADTVAATIMVP